MDATFCKGSSTETLRLNLAGVGLPLAMGFIVLRPPGGFGVFKDWTAAPPPFFSAATDRWLKGVVGEAGEDIDEEAIVDDDEGEDIAGVMVLYIDRSFIVPLERKTLKAE